MARLGKVTKDHSRRSFWIEAVIHYIAYAEL